MDKTNSLQEAINKWKETLKKLKEIKNTRGMGPVDTVVNSSKVYDKGGNENFHLLFLLFWKRFCIFADWIKDF